MQTSQDIFRGKAVLGKDQLELEEIHLRVREADSSLNEKLDPAIERWNAAAAEIEGLLAQDRKSLESTSARLSEIQEVIDARIDRNAALAISLQKRMLAKATAGSDLARKVEVNTRELAILSRLLRERELASEIAEDSARWIARVYHSSRSSPWWWRLMPRRWQNRKMSERLRRQGVFDGRAYLKRYPDVARARVDPLQHYIASGMAEGRLR